MRVRALLLSLLLVSTVSRPAVADEHQHSLGMGKVGTVVFPVSCSPAAQQAFPHAVALLHSFAYEEALREFTAIAKQDPQCAMAYWGQAMTWWRPLWYLPNAKALQAGSEAMARAVALPAKTEREQGFIAAAEWLLYRRCHARSPHALPGLPHPHGTAVCAIPAGPRGRRLLRSGAARHLLSA